MQVWKNGPVQDSGDELVKTFAEMSLTSGEASLLVTLGELDVEIGDQGVDVIIALDLQTEGGGEGQVLWLHSVDVHFLEQQNELIFMNLQHSDGQTQDTTCL